MTVTILAIAFILIVLAITVIGFKIVIRQGKPPEEINAERCSLCRQPFSKNQLVERQIGDHRLYFFCPSCINSLHRELTSKN
jgi:hypothetical protein